MYPGGDYSQLYDSTGPRVYPNLINVQQLPVVSGDNNSVNKICGVCGDKAKSLHFGGMACDSCKAFFRRSVQNDAYKHFRCAYDGRCHITMNSRKSCQNCRFSKCVDIGMEKSWVMTEEERLQQSKLREEKKRQKRDEDMKKRHTQEAKLHPHQPRIEDRHLYLSENDVTDIELLLDTFYETYQTSPPPVDVQPETMSCKLRVVNVFVNTISRVVQYVSNLPRFQRIANCDKPILLKHGVLAMTILRGTMVYDTSTSFFSLKTGDRVDSGASISFDEMKSILTDDLYQDHFKFIKAMKALQLNEATLMILQMVVLFSSDRMGLTDIEPISKEQDFYTSLIHKYMRWWYGEENTKLLYPKMLHRLADLRTLTEAHSDHTVHIPDPDFVKVVESFSKIDLNPYPYWSGFGGSEGEQRDAYRGAMASPTTSQQQHRQNSHHSNGNGMSGSENPRAVSSAVTPCPSVVDATVRAGSVHIKPTAVLQSFQPSVNEGQSNNPVRHVHHVPCAGYVYVSSTRGAAADRHVHPDSTSQLYQTAEYGTYQPEMYTAKSWPPTEYSGDGCSARQEGSMLNWTVESRQQHLQQHGEQHQQNRQPPVAFANVQDFSDFQAILGMEQRNRNCNSSEGLQPVQPQPTAPRCYIKSETTSTGSGRQVLTPPEPLQLRLKSEEPAVSNGSLQSPAVPADNYQHHQQQVELTAAGSFTPAAGQQLSNESASVYQTEAQSSVPHPPPPQYMQYPTQPPPYPDMGW